MSADGYAILRKSTLAYLLECYRVAGESAPEPPEEVVRDLRGTVTGDLRAPEPEGERLRAVGPVLALDEHLALLAEDRDLKLPDGRAGEFWRLVARVVHSMLTNEAEAVLRLIGAER